MQRVTTSAAISAQRETMRSIDRHADAGQFAVDFSSLALTASATILVVGVAPMLVSAGTWAAFGTLQAGSILRGVATFHETGSLTEAVVDYSIEVIVGVILLGAPMGAASTAVMSEARAASGAATRAAQSTQAALAAEDRMVDLALRGVRPLDDAAAATRRALELSRASIDAAVAAETASAAAMRASAQSGRVMIVVAAYTEGALEGAKEYVKTGDIGSALQTAAIRTGVDIVAPAMGELFERAAVPISNFMIRNPNAWNEVARAAQAAAGMNFAGQVTLDATGDWLVGLRGPSGGPGPTTPSGPPPGRRREAGYWKDLSACKMSPSDYVWKIALRRL